MLLEKQKAKQGSLKQTANLFKSQSDLPAVDLAELDEKIQENKKEMDKISSDLNDYTYAENDSIDQKSKYTIYILWVILVVLTLWVSLQLYLSEPYYISLYIYIFVGIWILFFINYYYQSMVEYGKMIGAGLSEVISFVPLP